MVFEWNRGERVKSYGSVTEDGGIESERSAEGGSETGGNMGGGGSKRGGDEEDGGRSKKAGGAKVDRFSVVLVKGCTTGC
jgi:hypothetical protein